MSGLGGGGHCVLLPEASLWLHSCPPSPTAFIMSTAPYLVFASSLLPAAALNFAPSPGPPAVPCPAPCLEDHVRGLRVVPQPDPVPVGAGLVVVVCG